MFAQRALARSLVRSSRLTTIGSKPTSSFFFTPRRLITTESIPESAASRILASQRLHRPISPHLTIYQPQLTWYLSTLTRITGVALSGTLYLFFIGYSTSSLFGGDLSSNAVSKWFGELPSIVKVGVFKIPLGAAFSYHFWNGVRHLVWDTGSELTVRGVYRTGYGVLGLTAVSTLGLLLV